MRTFAAALLLSLLLPLASFAQGLDIRVAAGPTLRDAGHSVAAGLGFSPTSKVTFAVNFERTHLETTVTRFPDGVSTFRGGTLKLGTLELQIAPWDRGRVRPYGVFGFAAGESQPNVNEQFPNKVTNRVRALLIGGGVRVPLSNRLSIFADARMMGGAEGIDGIVAVAPLRAGISWKF